MPRVNVYQVTRIIEKDEFGSDLIGLNVDYPDAKMLVPAAVGGRTRVEKERSRLFLN